jgi:hypothetical protein
MTDAEIAYIYNKKEIARLYGESYLNNIFSQEKQIVDIVFHTPYIARKFKRHFYHLSALFMVHKNNARHYKLLVMATAEFLIGLESIRKTLPISVFDQENDIALNDRLFKDVTYCQDGCSELLSMFKEADRMLVPVYFSKIQDIIDKDTFNGVKHAVDFLFDEFNVNILAKPINEHLIGSGVLVATKPKAKSYVIPVD